MSDNQFVRWKKLSVEAAAIVASILLAFSIDAWWHERTSDAELRLELVSVMGELEENRRRVELEIALLDRITSAGTTLLEALDAEADAATVSVPDSLAWLTTVWSPTLDASFGAVDALVSSGRLAQVDDLALRTGLAGIKAQFQDALEEELSARVVQYNLFFPLAIDKADLRAIYQYDDEYFSKIRYSISNLDLPTNVNVDYPNSLAIRNSIRDRMGWLRTGLEEMNSLLIELDDLIAMLQGPKN